MAMQNELTRGAKPPAPRNEMAAGAVEYPVRRACTENPAVLMSGGPVMADLRHFSWWQHSPSVVSR